MDTHGFVIVRERALELLGVRAVLWKHNATGAELLQLASDEPNLTFAVGFATIPGDDTGVAHILEHMVLAGSERFPVKDPFFEMVKGSVAGFINAMTWPDRTVYPFATENERDFINLMNVYLDAVFRPRLTRETFDQEAWHFEPGDEPGTLRYRGVVFNEMKGAVGNPDRALERMESETLLPGTPYRFDSGGDPAAIPDLTYEQLQAFHHDYYHPSRARFLLHGPVPLAQSMALIARYLEGQPALPPLEPPAHPAPFDAPRKATGHYPADEQGKAMATVSWVVPEAETLADALAWELLERVLIGTPAAPLRRALLDAALGEAFIGGLDGERRTTLFSAGLRGVENDRVSDVHALVMNTIARIASEGIREEDVQAARNRLEFSLRELDAWGGQRGLAIGLNLMGRWLHGRDPFAELDVDTALRELDSMFQTAGGAGRALTVLLKNHLVDGVHRADITILPDTKLSESRDDAEAKRLAAVAATLDAAGHERVKAGVEALEAHQKRPDSDEAKATIPRLTRDDLADTRAPATLVSSTHAGTELLWAEQPTRGLLYVDATFDLRNLPAQLLPHVGILGRALLETGTTQHPLDEMTRRIDRDTGGIGFDLEVSPPARAGSEGVARFVLHGKAIASKADTLVDLMLELLREARLDDRDALRRLAVEDLARRRNALEAAGTQFALRRLAAHGSAEGRLSEMLGGLSSLTNLRTLIGRMDNDWDALRDELMMLRDQLLVRSGMVLGVTADGDARARSDSAIRTLIEGLPTATQAGAMADLALPAAMEGWTLPGQVHYSGIRWNLGGGQLPGAWMAATRHLSADVLIPILRFQGGAYGAGAMIDTLNGAFAAQAYRDPNLKETFAVFHALPEHLREAARTLDDNAIDTLIVGSVGKLDPYALPGATGYRAFMRRLRGTEGEVARLRRELLATTRQDFLDLADAIASAPEPNAVVLGPKASLEAYGQARGWVIQTPTA